MGGNIIEKLAYAYDVDLTRESLEEVNAMAEQFRETAAHYQPVKGVNVSKVITVSRQNRIEDERVECGRIEVEAV
jgi:hypothetical protein